MTEIKLILDTGTLEGAIHDLIGAIRELSGNTITPATEPKPSLKMPTVTDPSDALITYTASEASATPEKETTETKEPEAATPKEPVCTVSDLSRAGAALIDQGKMPQLIELLRKFGVQAVTQLKPEAYPEFMEALRELGAKL